MNSVNTVLGPIRTQDLGVTLMHEHLMLSAAGIPQNYPELLGPDYRDRILEGLHRAKAGGVDTIVDGTTLDLGRDVTLMAEMSQATGVNIVACTGWWIDLPRFLQGVSPDQLARLMVREITVGIAGTSVKAGVIKAACSESEMSLLQEAALRAAARAHKETGVPIALHSHHPSRMGLVQLAILQQEGVDLHHVKLDHANDTDDLIYLKQLLDHRCFVGMDRYPGWGLAPQDRTRTLVQLISEGYLDQLVVSHDWQLAHIVGDNPLVSEEDILKLNPYGFLYLSTVVFPSLGEFGVDRKAIQTLTVDNPRRFFEGSTAV